MTLSLKQLDSLIDALIENSEQLIKEAHLLNNAGHYARAYSLAHFAREELSKSYMLQAAATKILVGTKVDWKQLMKRFRDHNDKLRLDTLNNGLLLKDDDDIKFEDIAHNLGGISKHRNNQKNASLYIDINNGVVSKPSDIIGKDKAYRTIVLAEMSFEQQSSHKKRVGNYADRKKIEMKLPDFEKMSQEQLMQMVKSLAPVMREIMKNKSDG